MKCVVFKILLQDATNTFVTLWHVGKKKAFVVYFDDVTTFQT